MLNEDAASVSQRKPDDSFQVIHSIKDALIEALPEDRRVRIQTPAKQNELLSRIATVHMNRRYRANALLAPGSVTTMANQCRDTAKSIERLRKWLDIRYATQDHIKTFYNSGASWVRSLANLPDVEPFRLSDGTPVSYDACPDFGGLVMGLERLQAIAVGQEKYFRELRKNVHKSDIESTIAGDIADCWARLFDEEPGYTTDPDTGDVSGPFVRFALTFEELTNPRANGQASERTVASALRRRNSQRNA
jgi:hypothetical protein